METLQIYTFLLFYLYMTNLNRQICKFGYFPYLCPLSLFSDENYGHILYYMLYTYR